MAVLATVAGSVALLCVGLPISQRCVLFDHAAVLMRLDWKLGHTCNVADDIMSLLHLSPRLLRSRARASGHHRAAQRRICGPSGQPQQDFIEIHATDNEALSIRSFTDRQHLCLQASLININVLCIPWYVARYTFAVARPRWFKGHLYVSNTTKV